MERTFVAPRIKSIVSCYNLCIQSFDRLAKTLLSQDQGFFDQRVALRDELGRFRVWAGNSGAHRTGRVSLDHRLREALHVHGKVTNLLDDLDRALEEAITLITQEEGPWDTSSSDASSDSSHTSLDDGPSNTHEAEEELPSTTELEYAFLNITHVVTCLYRFSVALRQPAPRDRLQKYAAIDVSHYDKNDQDHAGNKFKQAPEYLQKRMGKANTRRRQLLQYHKNHHDKIADYDDGNDFQRKESGTSITAKSSQKSGTRINSQTTVTTYKIEKDTMDCVGAASEAGQSQTSYTTSNATENEIRLQVPPPPSGAMLDGETPFQCPYCFSLVTMKSTHHWMKHVFKDLRPYICTFEDCPKPDQMFEYRRDWYEHEGQVHRREWFCAGCERIFASKDKLVDHLRQSHQDEGQESELLDLAERCERTIVAGLQPCPLCSEKRSPKRLRGHLARHMQQLALFVLPLNVEPKSDSSEPGDAQSLETTADGRATDSSDESDLAFDLNPDRDHTEEVFQDLVVSGNSDHTDEVFRDPVVSGNNGNVDKEGADSNHFELLPTSFQGGGNVGTGLGGIISYTPSPQQEALKEFAETYIAYGAAFNSRRFEHEPTCSYNTQVDPISKIMRWSDGPTDASIFWLNGEAGIGKSTIARTVARMWADEKRLGASFCFVRGWGDMAHASKFFTTLAYQLACVHPNIATGVYKTLCDYPDVPRQSLREQWKYLILEPLSRLDGVSHPQSLILVIDALDECDDENDIALILLLLSQAGTLKSVRLQVFITSRPEAQIRYGFDNIPKACFTVFELDTITSLSRLVEKADGLA